MRSYWESKHFGQWEVVVVGAGLVGLATALAVRARRPNASILVLERGLLAAGATGRNAGFACFGSLTELLADVDSVGWDATLALVERRFRGSSALLARVGADGAGYQHTGGWELIEPHTVGVLDRLDEVEQALCPVLGAGAVRLDDARLGDFGFDRARVPHLVSLPREGALDSGRLMRTLLRLCGAADITVWTGADVAAVTPDGDHVRVEVGDLALRARHVAICTNAFTRALLPELELTPGRGQVLVTEPVEGLPFRGVFHLDEGYVYFREVDGRVLLGGGRNLDFTGEATTALATTQPIQAYLDGLLRDVILPGRTVGVTHRWAGIMAFGPSKAPIVRTVAPGVSVGVRMGGMGVALGSGVAEELADLIVGAGRV
jgi:glycine/D-amino acid oxidase-like deaminating enzyme